MMATSKETHPKKSMAVSEEHARRKKRQRERNTPEKIVSASENAPDEDEASS
jgi:hypothetical protein